MKFLITGGCGFLGSNIASKILDQGDWIKFIIFFNLIIIINLFTMFIGFWVSRKIT